MNKIYPVDIKKIDETYDFYLEVKETYQRAKEYLLNFKWCSRTIGAELYLNMGKVLCIFLFEIENNQSDDDNRIWVVVGDLPSLYLDVYGARSTKEVLLNYIDLAKEWIEGVMQDKPLDDCFPFNKNPAKKLAKMLQSRVDFLENSILENVDDLPIQEI